MRLPTLNPFSLRWTAFTMTCLLCTEILSLGTGIAAAQDQGRTVWDGVYTQAQAADGAETYRASCASCHGESLAGAESAPALLGPAFNSTWNGTTLNDLVERIRVSMPSDDPGSLSRRRVTDVVAFMLSAGGFPAGEFILDRQAAVQSQIRFLTNRP